MSSIGPNSKQNYPKSLNFSEREMHAFPEQAHSITISQLADDTTLYFNSKTIYLLL